MSQVFIEMAQILFKMWLNELISNSASQQSTTFWLNGGDMRIQLMYLLHQRWNRSNLLARWLCLRWNQACNKNQNKGYLNEQSITQSYCFKRKNEKGIEQSKNVLAKSVLCLERFLLFRERKSTSKCYKTIQFWRNNNCSQLLIRKINLF